MIHQLAKVNRKAALIFNRDIKLRMKRNTNEINWNKKQVVECIKTLVDSFQWDHSPQGYDFWCKTFSKADKHHD